MRHVIEITGYGKHRRYIIKQIVIKGLLVPVSRPYGTLDAAQDAALLAIKTRSGLVGRIFDRRSVSPRMRGVD